MGIVVGQTVESVMETMAASVDDLSIVDREDASELQRRVHLRSEENRIVTPSYDRADPRRFISELLIFWYRNDAKIDALYSQLAGRVIEEQKETVSKGVGGTGKLGFELGSLLAILGLAKGKAEGELHSDYETILEITSGLSVENKTALLLAHLRQEEQLAHVELFSNNLDEVLGAITKARFQVISGSFTYSTEEDAKRGELRSTLRDPGGSGSFVRVPLLLDLQTPNQAINAFDDEDPFPHEIFCESIVRRGWILANPIAIWLPHSNPDTDMIEWSSGSDTELS